MKKLIVDLVDTRTALDNCHIGGNTDWATRWQRRLDKLVNMLPSGAGFDAGTKVLSLSEKKSGLFYQLSSHERHRLLCGLD